ncbi:PKD domain-containing protein [Fluviicola taffensis]|uniref:PKD domain-containing protein n=1 Tax=Fluviicola taffensis TaxID=191579 RepID=UPI00313845BA
MRKILLSLSLLTLTLHASAQTQIGNGNFEGWETATSELTEPVNWNSFKTASGTWNSFGGQQMNRSSNVRPGSTGIYSVRIWARNAGFGVVAQGNMTLGRIEMGSTTANSTSNYNYSNTTDANYSEAFTDRPDSVVVWVKYKPMNTGAGHMARISTVIHNNTNNYKDPNDVGGANTIATAILNFPYSGGNWQRISIPFNYVGTPANAAFILTTIATNNVPGGGTVSDSLYIDDMELVYVPKALFTTSGNTVCPNVPVTFTSTSTNYPTSYSWNFGDGSPASTTQNPSHPYATSGTYNVTLTVTNQWGSTTSTATTITVTTPPDASLSYAQATYCPADTDPVPTATNAGTFSSTAGLTINASTGAIDLSASNPGVYTVTNTYTGGCGNTGTTSVTINPPANSSFSYPSNTICVGSSNQTPTIVDAGTFSATPAGLVFVSPTTGVIDVAGSTPGTYTITYDATGSVACPTSGSSSNVSVTITSSPDASFTYAQAAYCADATDPAPVFGVGANGGVFSSTSGLTINTNTGEIDLSASTAGTYTVTNTIAASGSCPMADDTYSVTINALPTVALGNFSQVCVYNPAFALTGGTPAGGSYSGTGVSGGNFNPSTAGLGTKTITYAYTDANGCANTATNSIVVDACLGLGDNEIATISVYPNPTDGKLTLSNVVENTSFNIVSVSGQVVLNGVVSNTANTIDLSSFENGIYVLQLTQEQGLQTIRIVKK